MSRIRIDDITRPPAEYRIWRGRTPALAEFEAVATTRAEDRLRIQRAGRRSVREALGRARIRRLIRNIVRTGRLERRSLASSVYMRDLRQRVSGQVWWLVERTLNLRPLTFTLFPRGWEVPAGQLHTFDPVRKLAALRSLINRCGGGNAGGYLLAFIHGEFEPGRQVYQLHVHCIAAGGLWDVVNETVRKMPSVKTIEGTYGTTGFVRHRLRMDGELTDLPRPLTYLVKSYWPSKLQYRNTHGKLRRSRWATRIAEPHHTEMLLWLDQWRLHDLTLLMNLSIGRDGFCLSDRAYTNGDIQ